MGYRADGTPVEIPYLRAGSGERELLLVAGVHGDEVSGVLSVLRLVEWLRGVSLHGEVGVVVVANPEGFNYGFRGIPLSTVDTNRVYPGDPSGSLAERVAAAVFGLAERYRVVVDVHSAGYSIPFALVDPAPPELRERVEELARLTRVTVLGEYGAAKYELRRLSASLAGALVARGRPSFTLELPSALTPREPAVDAGFKALKNLVVGLGLAEDSAEEITEYPVIRERGLQREDVVAEAPGLLRYHVDRGQEVGRGDLLATVVSVYGDPVGEVRAPERGYVVALSASMRAWTGSTVALMAVRRGTEPATTGGR